MNYSICGIALKDIIACIIVNFVNGGLIQPGMEIKKAFRMAVRNKKTFLLIVLINSYFAENRSCSAKEEISSYADISPFVSPSRLILSPLVTTLDRR